MKLKNLLYSNTIKKLSMPFAVYIGGNFVNQLIPLLLLPVLTRYLTPSDYGVWATFMAISGIVTTVIGMGTVGAVTRGYFDKHKKDYNFAEYTSNALFVNFIAFVAILCLILISGPFIFNRLDIAAYWPLLLPLIGLASAVYLTPVKLFIFKGQPVAFAVAEASGTLTEILLSIFFVVCLSMGWRGRVLGVSISWVVFMAIGAVILFRSKLISFVIRKDYIKDILHYGLPLVFNALGITIVAATDKVCLNKMAGLSATGLYSVAFSIASIIVFFNGAFYLAWQPILYEKLNSVTDTIRIKLVKYTYLFFILVTLIAAALVAVSPILLKMIVGEKFYAASKFILWLAMANIFHGMYVMMSGYVAFQKKTYYLGIIAGVTVFVNIAMNLVLIRLNGPIGAAQAMFFTYLTKFSLMWYFSNRVCPMPWFSIFKKHAYS